MVSQETKRSIFKTVLYQEHNLNLNKLIEFYKEGVSLGLILKEQKKGVVKC